MLSDLSTFLTLSSAGLSATYMSPEQHKGGCTSKVRIRDPIHCDLKLLMQIKKVCFTGSQDG